MLRPLLILSALACSSSNPAPPSAGGPPPAADAAAASPQAKAPPPSPPDAAPPSAGWRMESAMDLAQASDGTYTSGGKLPPKPPEQAIFRVTPGPAATTKDLAADAKQRLASTDLATGVKVDGQKPITIDGVKGFETTGRGKLEGADVSLYQVVLYDADASFTLQGRSSTDRFAWYQPSYQKMAKTFQRRAR